MITIVSTKTAKHLVKSLENPIFLGEWCVDKSWSSESTSEHPAIDVPVFPHPWNAAAERDKAIGDFTECYDQVMSMLAEELNEIHGQKYSTRYWEILVGPWLRTYGFVTFEKFTLLRQLSKDFGGKVQLLIDRELHPVVQDTHEFKDVYTSHDFMLTVTAEVANLLKIRSVVRDFSLRQNLDDQSQPVGRSKSFKETRLDSVIKFSKWLAKDTDAIIFQTFQSPWKDILWNLRLGQAPIWWNFPRVPGYVGNIDLGFRGKSVVNDYTSFFNVLLTLARRNLPLCFLENYSRAREFVSELELPERPKWIFTSNAYFKFESFKMYAAQQSERGIPLLIGQHGGGFGTAKENSHERHIRKVADAFFTWGWTEDDKTIPTSVLKPLRKMKPRTSGYFLLIQFVAPDFIHEPSSMPLGKSNWLEYWDDQVKFYGALPEEIRDKVRVRLYPGASYSNQRKMWRAAFPKVKFDRPGTPLRASMARASLVIVTYESTTYLQCLNSSFPMICFWRTDHWPMRDSARNEFYELVRSKIFTEDPIEAAKFVSNYQTFPDEYKHSYKRILRSTFTSSYAAREPILSTSVRTFTNSLLARAKAN